jgi:hypothetical protein
MNQFLKGMKSLFRAAHGDSDRLKEGAEQMLHGMQKSRADFEQKKKEVDNDIKRGAKRSDHKLPL